MKNTETVVGNVKYSNKPTQKKEKDLTLDILLKIRGEGHGTVVYIFPDGSRLVASVNKEIFIDEKGKWESLSEVVKIFHSTAWDLKADSFELSH